MDITQNIKKLALKNLHNLKACPERMKSSIMDLKKLIITNSLLFSPNKKELEISSQSPKILSRLYANIFQNVLQKLIKIFAIQVKRVKINKLHQLQ